MRCQVVTDRLLDSAAAHVELARFAFLPHTEVLTASPTSAREFDRWAVRGPGTLSRQRGELDSSLGHFVQQARKERGALVPPMSEELGVVGSDDDRIRDGAVEHDPSSSGDEVIDITVDVRRGGVRFVGSLRIGLFVRHSV